MLSYFGINLVISILIAIVFVIPVYYAISSLRTFDKSKHTTWKKVVINTPIKADDFIKQVKKLCLHRKYILLEISPTHAYIKENMSFSSGGVVFYLELNGPDSLNVWARGSIYKNRINPNCVVSMANMFYS
jgi:hypothetical protein